MLNQRTWTAAARTLKRLRHVARPSCALAPSLSRTGETLSCIQAVTCSRCIIALAQAAGSQRDSEGKGIINLTKLPRLPPADDVWLPSQHYESSSGPRWELASGVVGAHGPPLKATTPRPCLAPPPPRRPSPSPSCNSTSTTAAASPSLTFVAASL